MNQYRILKNVTDTTVDELAVLLTDISGELVSRNQCAGFIRPDTRVFTDEHLKAIQNATANDENHPFVKSLREVYALIDSMFMRENDESIIVPPTDMSEVEDEFGDLEDVLSMDEEVEELYSKEEASEDNDGLSDDDLDDLFDDEVTGAAEVKEVPPITEEWPGSDIDFDNLPPSDDPVIGGDFDNIVDIEDDLLDDELEL